MMNAIPIYTPHGWTDYELIDSGEGQKLERFGSYIVSRPDPRALWKKAAPDTVWQTAHATFERTTDTTGTWKTITDPPDPWHISYDRITISLHPSSFKHLGIFPEQAVNWQWLSQVINGRPLRVLNLFGYTGIATLVAAASGATVTHVDASKPAITWAKENAMLSSLSDKPIRWILDDAVGFLLREKRRGNTYDGIIMDPPRFGRGAKGEVWKLETDLPRLFSAVSDILSPSPAFVLVNAYTTDISAIALSNLLSDIVPDNGTNDLGELAIADSTSSRLLPNGIFARWSTI